MKETQLKVQSIKAEQRAVKQGLLNKKTSHILEFGPILEWLNSDGFSYRISSYKSFLSDFYLNLYC